VLFQPTRTEFDTFKHQIKTRLVRKLSAGFVTSTLYGMLPNIIRRILLRAALTIVALFPGTDRRRKKEACVRRT
jgi:hypothetical protein